MVLKMLQLSTCRENLLDYYNNDDEDTTRTIMMMMILMMMIVTMFVFDYLEKA